jgi:hypothetical protein
MASVAVHSGMTFLCAPEDTKRGRESEREEEVERDK